VYALWTIPAARSAGFFLRYSVYARTTAIQWSNHPSLHRCFIRVDPRKSVAIFFLNCTKNTELTRAQFARTVTFALT
jgi:hypothetical protein